MMDFEKKKAKIKLVYLMDDEERVAESDVEYSFAGSVYAHAVGMVEGVVEDGGLVKDLKIFW